MASANIGNIRRRACALRRIDGGRVAGYPDVVTNGIIGDAGEEGPTAGLFGSDDNALDVGSMVAAAGGRALATYVAKSTPSFLAALRREPFLYNLYFSGVYGDYQVAGLRISNPHPDVLYLGNALLDEGDALNLRVACVLLGDHDRPKAYEPRQSMIPLPGEGPWLRKGRLTERSERADQKKVMHESGLELAPLGSIDLIFYFERRDEKRAFSGGKVTLDLAAQGYRSRITNTSLSFFLRNLPLVGSPDVDPDEEGA